MVRSIILTSHLDQIRDTWHSQAFTKWHIVIGLSQHIHSFIHLMIRGGYSGKAEAYDTGRLNVVEYGMMFTVIILIRYEEDYPTYVKDCIGS